MGFELVPELFHSLILFELGSQLFCETVNEPAPTNLSGALFPNIVAPNALFCFINPGKAFAKEEPIFTSNTESDDVIFKLGNNSSVPVICVIGFCEES